MGVAALLLAAAFGLASAPPAFAESTKKTTESVASMLQEAKLKFEKKGNSFIVLFKGKGIGEFPVIITVNDDILVMVSVVAPAEKVTKSAELIAGLFAANNDYTFLKILLDPKGNLIFRYDIFENMVDAKDLKKLIGALTENTINMYNNAPFIKK